MIPKNPRISFHCYSDPDSKRLNLSMAGLSCISFVGQLPTDAMIPVARSRFIMSRQFGTYRDPAQVQLKSKKFME